MAIIRDKVLHSLLNKSALKSVLLLAFIKSKKKGVTVAQAEEFWSKHEDGREITRSNKVGTRTVDNTIRSTLQKLATGKKKFLISEKIGKSYVYFYNEETDELKNNLLDSENIPDLIRWALTFQKYKGLTFMEELEDLLGLSFDDLLVEYDLEKENLRPYIDFETNDRIYSGWGQNVSDNDITNNVAKHMAIFYKVISWSNETVEFEYRSFQTGTIRTITHAKPYLLKEHNKRWYLIASVDDSAELYPFSLDRILTITEGFASKKYFIQTDFNPVEYWKDCVGIYRDEINGVQEVSFELKNGPRYNNINYLISSPLHSSQKVIKVDEVWKRFQFKIHIGPEVVRHIRQWGLDNVRNIYPESLDEDVRNG